MNDMFTKSIILAIESSSDLCGIALSIDNELVAEQYLISKNLHDKLLADIIRKLLSDLSLKVADLSAVAISSGPGSFTGLRIGASLTKGICFGNAPKLISIPTLEAIAYGFRLESTFINEELISVIIPSHKNQSYFQQFTSNLQSINPIVLIENDAICNFIDDSIIIKTDRKLLLDLPNKIIITSPIYPRYILALAQKYYSQDNFILSEEFTPNYAQEFELKTGK